MSLSFVANADIYPSRIVKLVGERKVEQATDSDINPPIGVSHEGTNYPPLTNITISNVAASAGQSVTVYVDGDTAMVEAGDAVPAGSYVTADADGKGIAAGSANSNVVGIALDSAASAGEKIVVLINPSKFDVTTTTSGI